MSVMKLEPIILLRILFDSKARTSLLTEGSRGHFARPLPFVSGQTLTFDLEAILNGSSGCGSKRFPTTHQDGFTMALNVSHLT